VLPRYLLLSLVTSFAMTACAFSVARSAALTQTSGPAALPPRFLSRLPMPLREADLWALEAEDHYLRVHTALGQELILMRLGDAIHDLLGIEGARTHRSWWVARHGVREIRRGDGRATLILPDGSPVPVSRGQRRTLRDEGWF
jgi:DNA-binding LytR/AlgR family response regulator